MSEPEFSLRSMLSDVSAAPLSSTLPIGPLLAAVGQAGAALPAGSPPGLETALRAALDEALHIDLNGVVTAAWGKVGALTTAIKATRADPESLAVVPLLDHAITSHHTPHIDLMHSGQTLLSLSLDILLTLNLKGVTVDVRQGRLHGAKSGHAVGEAVISFLGQPLIKKSSNEFALPGRFALAAPSPEPLPTVASGD